MTDPVARMEEAIAILDRADRAYKTVRERQMELIQVGLERIIAVLPGHTDVSVRPVRRTSRTDVLMLSVFVRWFPANEILGDVVPGWAVQQWLTRLKDNTIAEVIPEGQWLWNTGGTGAPSIEQHFTLRYRLFNAEDQPDIMEIGKDDAAIEARLRQIFNAPHLVAQEPGQADESWVASEPDAEGDIIPAGALKVDMKTMEFIDDIGNTVPLRASLMTPGELKAYEEGQAKDFPMAAAWDAINDDAAAIDAELERLKAEYEASVEENPYLPTGWDAELDRPER